MKKFKAFIKNITKDNYLKEGIDVRGAVVLTTDKKEAIVFYEEYDATSTLEYLNDTKEDCYTLITF